MERKDYETAVKIADTIDWERVRNIKMLSTVSLAYEKVSRFEEAKDILLMAYECAPVGRRFLYKLTELAIKQGEYDEAEDYLKEFAATSPQDPSRLVLRYEIAKAKGEPTDRLITILEAYQKREFEEKWSYELASLYYRVGKNEECVKLCDEIVLWFSVGTYVEKAMELKQRIAPLTPDQIEKRENKEKYLRRLEEVQKEFEDKYRVLQEPTKEAVEAVVAQEETAAVVTEEVSEAVLTEETMSEDVATDEILAEAMAEEPEPEVTQETEDLLERESQRLQEEMEASLAREIETASLTAALNEAVLRETAATMETMETETNDHSQEKERTKVAVVHVPMHEKTKEFVREARIINVVLEEARGEQVTLQQVEERLQEELVAEVVVAETVAEEVATEEMTTETPVAEAPTAEEVAEAEPEVEVPAEESYVEESPVEDSVEEKVVAEISVAKEPVMEAAVEETPVEEAPVADIPSGSSAPAVNDHYVLVTCQDENEGVKECVSYIRRMRELLGYPVTQVAKIAGVKLAAKDMAQTLRKLQGRDLVVVGIAGLPDALLIQTIGLMAADAIESFIALVGTEDEIAQLQSRVAFFANCRVISCCGAVPVAAITQEPVKESVMETHVQEPAVHVCDTSEEISAASMAEEQSQLAKMVEEALRANVISAMNDEQKAEKQEAKEQVSLEAEVMIEESSHIAAGELTAKEFYECAISYANMMDAKVDDMGGLAIYAAAEGYQQERQPLTEELAQELVDMAIQKAERRTLKSLFANRYDKEGFLILKEQHFKE